MLSPSWCCASTLPHLPASRFGDVGSWIGEVGRGALLVAEVANSGLLSNHWSAEMQSVPEIENIIASIFQMMGYLYLFSLRADLGGDVKLVLVQCPLQLHSQVLLENVQEQSLVHHLTVHVLSVFSGARCSAARRCPPPACCLMTTAPPLGPHRAASLHAVWSLPRNCTNLWASCVCPSVASKQDLSLIHI